MIKRKQKKSKQSTIFQQQLKDLEATYYQNNPTITLKKALLLNKIDPNNIFINSVIAISLRSLNRLEESLKYFKNMIKLNPKSADTLSNVGVILNGLKRFDEAVVYYTKALEIDSNNSTVCSNLGNVLRELGRYDEAIEYCKRAISLDSNFAEAYNNLGFALKKIGKNDDALANYDKAIKYNPNLANAYVNKAAVLMEKQNYSDAIINCEIALKLDNNSADSYKVLASVYMSTEEYEKSFLVFKQALAINSNSSDSYNGLASCLMYMGKYEESLINFKHALAIDKANINIYDSLFALYLQTNNYSKFDILKYINYFETIKLTDKNIQAIIYLAIDKLLDGDIKSIEILLDKIQPFLNDTSLASYFTDNKKFIIAFHSYLKALVSLIDSNLQIDKSLERVYHIGESHSLSFANQTLTIEENKYLIKPCIIFGAKAFHISKNGENKFKHFLKNHIKNIPMNSKVIISFGEIDCRSDEGIITYHFKSGKRIDEIVQTTITGYINYVETLLLNRNITPYFTAVPAPVLNQEKENEIKRIEVIQKFNQTLKKELEKKSLNFIDVYSFTANEKGSSNLKYMCDNFHLSPKAINQLQVLFNALDANKKKQTSNTIDFSKYQTVSLSKPS